MKLKKGVLDQDVVSCAWNTILESALSSKETQIREAFVVKRL